MIEISLETRIKRLEDLEEIKNLMNTYCFHADEADGENWSQVFS